MSKDDSNGRAADFLWLWDGSQRLGRALRHRLDPPLNALPHGEVRLRVRKQALKQIDMAGTQIFW